MFWLFIQIKIKKIISSILRACNCHIDEKYLLVCSVIFYRCWWWWIPYDRKQRVFGCIFELKRFGDLFSLKKLASLFVFVRIRESWDFFFNFVIFPLFLRCIKRMYNNLKIELLIFNCEFAVWAVPIAKRDCSNFQTIHMKPLN